jgi:hypothetical protein
MGETLIEWLIQRRSCTPLYLGDPACKPQLVEFFYSSSIGGGSGRSSREEGGAAKVLRFGCRRHTARRLQTER